MVRTGVLATWNESPCGVFKNQSHTEITLAEANETYRFLIGILSSGGRHGMPPGDTWEKHSVCRDSQAGGELRVRTSGQAALLGVMMEYTSRRPEEIY